MVMVQQLQLKPQQQQKQQNSVVDSNQNGGSLKRAAGGGKDGVWPSQDNSLKVKKPMLGGRRIIGGPSTPVPRWKLYENPFYDGIAAAAAAAAQQQQQHRRAQVGGAGGGSVAVSARKLAATLWELQEFPFSLAAAAHAASGKASSCPCIQHRTSSSSSSSSTAAATALAARKARSPLLPFSEKKVTTINKFNSNLLSPPSPSTFQTDVAAPAPLPTSILQSPQQPAATAKESLMSLQHPNKGWDTVKKISQSNSKSSRQVAAMRSHVHRLLERRADARLTRLASVQGNSGSYMVLDSIQDIQDQQSTAMPPSVVAALRIELECTRERAHELELAHKSSRREVENLLKKVTEEKLLWRNKEEEKIRDAVQAIKLEAEDEKKTRRRVESVNRKMSRELINANIAVAKAVQELERERKARELMEDVCDELAREIGKDKAEVEELKRESVRVRDEVEEERQMLQMAEVWREERVQMKLGEARLAIEEKVAEMDSLRVQLEAFLESRKSLLDDIDGDEVSSRGALQEAENLANALNSLKLGDVPQDPCRSPNPSGEIPDLYRADESSSAISHPDGRRSWGWGVQSPDLYAASNHRLETREEVLERLRRKYDQNGPCNLMMSQSQDADAITRRIEDERGEGSDYNSPCEHQRYDTKEEEGSQWESVSEEEDALEALQQSNSNGSTTRGDHRVGGEDIDRPQSDGAAFACSSRLDSLSCAPVYPSARASPSEAPPADELWKVESPLGEHDASEEQLQQRRLSGESTKFLLGRGMADPCRNPFIKSISDQGTASPSRDWRSPDRGNPHIVRGIKGFIEWPKMSRENGMKNRVLEGRVDKLERRMLKQVS